MICKSIVSCLLTVAAIASGPLAALSAPGDLDTTFGGTGTVILPQSFGGSQYRRVRQQADGKLLVFGGSVNGRLVLKRYLDNGDLDYSFGYAGNGSWYNIPANPFIFGSAYDGEILPDGKIIVAGNVDTGDVTQPALWRFSANGVLDSTFGTDGRVLLSSENGTAHEVEVRLSKLIVIYTRSTGTYLTRRNSNGGLDITFGNFGTVQLSTTQALELFLDMKVASADGKIYVVRDSLRRYNSDGSSDLSFGVFGTAPKPSYNLCPGMPNPIGFSFTSIALAPGGKLLAGGMPFADSGAVYYLFTTAATRYTSTGQIDSTFNNGQFVCAGGVGFYNLALVTSQTNGKVLFGSYAGDDNLIRLNTDGSHDLTHTAFNVPDGQTDLMVQATDGKTVALFPGSMMRFMP